MACTVYKLLQSLPICLQDFQQAKEQAFYFYFFNSKEHVSGLNDVSGQPMFLMHVSHKHALQVCPINDQGTGVWF